MFQRLRDRIDAALTGVAHVTEHVGSTAVPGLDAKPVIDVDVVVSDQTAVKAAIEVLAAAGWQHQGDLGIEGREAFLPPADAVYHHLDVVVARSQPHRDHLDLRDFLRGHPGQTARYGESSAVSSARPVGPALCVSWIGRGPRAAASGIAGPPRTGLPSAL